MPVVGIHFTSKTHGLTTEDLTPWHGANRPNAQQKSRKSHSCVGLKTSTWGSPLYLYYKNRRWAVPISMVVSYDHGIGACHHTTALFLG